MTKTSLTEQQLTDIAARAQAATPGPWSPYTVHGPTFYANVAGPYLRGVGDLDFGVGEQAEADKEFVKHAQQDVTALVAAVRRLQAQRKYLIGQLAKRDAESGRGDQALREFLAAHPGEGEITEQLAEACGKCRQPFGPDEPRTRRAFQPETAYCRSCVDRCHDNEIADHRCVICA
ncbi:hypothetical protein ACFY74_11895 [Streptomyces massasporeus]|uniref:hypothetical protein n=1 Tax=Streptomyces massasporeus TaxID=67324 RepID=UPI0036A8A549